MSARALNARRKHQIPVGSTLAGVKILSVTRGSTLADTRYTVRFDCCGRVETLSHPQVRSRSKAGSHVCATCGHAASAATRRGDSPPTPTPEPPPKPTVPSAAYLLQIHDRAMDIVRARRSA